MRSGLARVWVSGLVMGIMGLCTMMADAQAADTGLAASCARAGNDDTLHPYDPALRPRLIKAYTQLFPNAPMPPPEVQLQAGSAIRCMSGHLLACFVGANLPCAKLNAARDNPAVDEFCQTNPRSDIVPAYVAGHDTLWTYRCVAGKPVIAGQTFSLDRRGFAAQLWAPLD